jgi:uncharacterized membrane protein
MDSESKKEVVQEDEAFRKKELVNFAGIRIGPLPPPAEMQEYERLYPGSAQMIFELWREQSRHRMELEKTIIYGNNKRANTAQIFSFLIVLIALAGGFTLIFLGKDIVGLASIITAITALVAVFLWGQGIKRDKKKEE